MDNMLLDQIKYPCESNKPLFSNVGFLEINKSPFKVLATIFRKSLFGLWKTIVLPLLDSATTTQSTLEQRGFVQAFYF